MKTLSALVVLSMAVGAPAAMAVAAEITVLTSLPAQHVVEQLTPKFEASGNKLKVTYSGTLDTRKRMADNQVFDVVIGARQELDKFAKEGKVTGATDFMTSQIGLAVRPGAPKPPLNDAGVRDALLNAKAIAYSTGSSGEYLTSTILPKLGIADQVKGKLKQVASGESSGKLVANGEADVAIQQISELIHFKGVDYVGALPQDLQLTTTYSAAVHNKVSNPDAARSFIALLTSAQAGAVIKDEGMTPVSPSQSKAE